MALPAQSAQGMAWSLLRAGTYVFQATCDLNSYSVVPFLATGAIPQSVIGGSGQVAAREMGIDNTGNSRAVSVMVGKLYIQTVPPYTQTTIELGDTAPMIQVTGGGVCLVTFSTTTVPGTEAATNPYAAALGAIGVFLPAGVITMYGGPAGNIPQGWLYCNGAAVSRANYPALYATIGTLYGVGDGSSTFNLPDMRGRFARGLDDGAGRDANRVLGSYQGVVMASHQHRLGMGQDGNGYAYFSLYQGAPVYGNRNISYQTIAYNYITSTQSGQGNWLEGYSSDYINPAGDLAPPNVAVLYMIKT